MYSDLKGANVTGELLFLDGCTWPQAARTTHTIIDKVTGHTCPGHHNLFTKIFALQLQNTKMILLYSSI